MSEAPERIYLQDAGDYEGAAKLEVTWCVEPQDDDDTAYIRADLVEAAVKRTIEACAAQWQEARVEGGFAVAATIAMADRIRALASDPEAIAKIVSGK